MDIYDQVRYFNIELKKNEMWEVLYFFYEIRPLCRCGTSV